MSKKYKKALAAVLAAVSLCACASEEEEASSGSVAELTGVPNPFVDYNSLEETIQAAGFDLTVPEPMEGYDQIVYQVMSDEMIQVIYYNKDQIEAYRIRKQAGDDDISGDYSTYSTNKEVEINGNTVTLSGKDDKYYKVIWTADGYSYAVDIDMNGEGLDEETVIALVEGIK